MRSHGETWVLKRPIFDLCLVNISLKRNDFGLKILPLPLHYSPIISPKNSCNYNVFVSKSTFEEGLKIAEFSNNHFDISLDISS